ncbi:MAG TPA: DUF4157 domain-containing protein [Jatrophihabitans sp.]|nr:DUF4157 domain-containing protein [Jatrophihabitans sp.]
MTGHAHDSARGESSLVERQPAGPEPVETPNILGLMPVPGLVRRTGSAARSGPPAAAGEPPPAGTLPALRRQAAHRSDRLPDALVQGIAELSGVGLDDVRVHRDSAAPGRLGAAAFTWDDDIHLGAGAERELAHEAWHVVQQRQGRVSQTGGVGGAAVNDDPRLEREADEMGARAARRAGLPELAPHASRAPTAAPPDRPGTTPSGAPLQARWLFLDADSALQKGYFWELELGVSQEDVPAPTRWSSEFRLVTPALTDYYRLGSISSRSATKGRSPALTEEEFTQKYGKAKASSPSDHYNPYGRFSTTASYLAFLPAVTMHDPGAFLADLKKREAQFEDIAEVGPANRDGIPGQVRTVGGHVLDLVDVTQFGALYADVPPSPGNAERDPSQAADSSALGLKAGPVSPVVSIASGSGEVHTAHVKIVQASRIDAKVLAAWDGKKRSKDQAAVMGCSAGEAAANAGYRADEGRGWEWLHLISHGMGGPDGTGPQHAGNLVVGTSECNSQMIVVEEVLKDLVKRYNLKAQLMVFANLCDPVRHIADRIGYDFVFSEASGDKVQVFHWEFDPLGRGNPMVAQNLLARIVARYHLGDTKTFTKPSMPMYTFGASSTSSTSGGDAPVKGKDTMMEEE